MSFYILMYLLIGWASRRVARQFDVWCDQPDREPELAFFWLWPIAWLKVLARVK